MFGGGRALARSHGGASWDDGNVLCADLEGGGRASVHM